MFCVKCGTQLPDDTIFCSSCGARLPTLNNVDTAEKSNNAVTAKKHGSCLFSIEWKRRGVFAWVAAVKVFIDGRFVKKLIIGETFSSVLDNGKHKMYFEAFGMGRTQSFEFTGDDNEIAYLIEIGASRNSFAVNKVKDTQPGTYNG